MKLNVLAMAFCGKDACSFHDNLFLLFSLFTIDVNNPNRAHFQMLRLFWPTESPVIWRHKRKKILKCNIVNMTLLMKEFYETICLPQFFLKQP